MKQVLIRRIFLSAVFAVLASGTWIATDVAAQSIPSTAVPAGYGRYCSVTYPGGAWQIVNLESPNSDPCKDLTKPGMNGTIQRAGLWAVHRKNNVLRTCDGDVGSYVGSGKAIIKTAFMEGTNKLNCVFTISPLMIRVFNRPYQAYPVQNDLVTVINRHNYNMYSKPINVRDYGQQPNPNCPTSRAILRDGRQTCFPHGGYDLGMPTGTVMKAIGDGLVREARWRDVTEFTGNPDCVKKSPQGEIYVEHQIGSGAYAERFIIYYAHVSKIDVKKGDRVTRGQRIGLSGDSGCSSRPHLHFGMFRTTNLSAHYRLNPSYPDEKYGISATHGLVDAFHFTAPAGVDPWAGISLENTYDSILDAIVMKPGAFSVWLWREGQAPKGYE